MLCAIWCHLCNLKNTRSTYGGVLLLVNLQALAWNFTKNNTRPCHFFTFFKSRKWYQVAQSTIYVCNSNNYTFAQVDDLTI